MSTRNRTSIRQILKGAAAAGKGASPDEVAKHCLSPVLARYFADVTSSRFLWRLTQAATTDEQPQATSSKPDGEARRIVGDANKGHHFTGLLWAWLSVITASLVMGLNWGLFGFVFPFLGPGFFAALIGSGIAQSIFREGRRFKRAVIVARATLAFERTETDYWRQLLWRELEIEVTNLFRHLGYSACTTPASNDRGVDVFAERSGEKIVIQCKQYSKPAQRNLVSELLGVKVAERAARAILVCTGGFTSGAEDYAVVHGIELWDLDDLVRNSKCQH